MSIISIVMVVIFVISLYTGANYYVYRKLFQFLNLIFPNTNVKIYFGIYIFLALSIILGRLPIYEWIKKAISWISSHWLGIFIYLFLFFLLIDIVILIGKIIKIIPAVIPQDMRFIFSLIAILLTAGFVSYGLYNANQIRTVAYNIKTNKSKSDIKMKIVMISDLHLGSVNSERNLEKIVQGVNELDPDIVCLPGDIFNDDFKSIKNPDRAKHLFKSINSKFGVYAVLGNHDGGKTLHEMIKFLENSNIKLLNDDYVVIDERLVLVGRLDPNPIGGFGDLERKDIKDILEKIVNLNKNLPVVVMDHNPSNIKEYGKEVDLIISGHTHRGQIFPGNLITRAVFDVDYGHYKKDENSPDVVVTSGAGTWEMPMRSGSNNEIVSILLY